MYFFLEAKDFYNKDGLVILLNIRYFTVKKHFDAYTYLETDAFISIDLCSFVQSMEMFQFESDLKQTLSILV